MSAGWLLAEYWGDRATYLSSFSKLAQALYTAMPSSQESRITQKLLGSRLRTGTLPLQLHFVGK